MCFLLLAARTDAINIRIIENLLLFVIGQELSLRGI
jgi:hypothetical protein